MQRCRCPPPHAIATLWYAAPHQSDSLISSVRRRYSLRCLHDDAVVHVTVMGWNGTRQTYLYFRLSPKEAHCYCKRAYNRTCFFNRFAAVSRKVPQNREALEAPVRDGGNLVLGPCTSPVLCLYFSSAIEFMCDVLCSTSCSWTSSSMPTACSPPPSYKYECSSFRVACLSLLQL